MRNHVSPGHYRRLSQTTAMQIISPHTRAGPFHEKGHQPKLGHMRVTDNMTADPTQSNPRVVNHGFNPDEMAPPDRASFKYYYTRC